MKTALVFVGGLLVGAALLMGVRLAVQPAPHNVHHHANWAIFVDGARLDLSDSRYMEDVFQCTVDPSHQEPEHRVHMHENNQDVVHVHASGVTWDHLLANLGFGVGDDYLDLDDRVLRSEGERTLKFIRNGTPLRSIRNLAIGDQDRLLISYGPESVEEAVQSQFPLVAADAGEYNVMPDPASCSGQVEEVWGVKLRRALLGG